MANTDSSSSGHSIAAERRPQRIDFFAFVKRLAADEQVRHATRFEGFHVAARDVVLIGDEAPEQQAHVAGARPGAALRRRS